MKINKDDCGIKATDTETGKQFLFYTHEQDLVEHAMTLMGYGCENYTLGVFIDIQKPMDKN